MNGSRSISYYAEAYGPAIAGLGTLALLALNQTPLLALMASDRLSVGNLFSAIFGWASIQTGCVFAIYGFVAGKTDGFIVEIRNTRSMRRFNSFIRRAIVSGFVLTLSSMPLIAWKFTITTDDRLLYLVFAGWFSVFVWAFCSFARVAYIFGLLIRFDDAPKKVGGG